MILIKIIFLGPPGGGKGTQAKMLSEKIKVPLLSTGDILRKEIEKNSPLGREAKKYVSEGKLVPDEIVVKIVKERLSEKDCEKGFILDGFPRTLPQAKALEEMVEINLVLNISVKLEKLLSRLSGRLTCSNCTAIYHVEEAPPKKKNICDLCGAQLYRRIDNSEDTIKRRFAEYEKQTAPLIVHYKKSGLLKNIDGNKPIKAIYEDILKIVLSCEEDAKKR